MHHEGGLIRSPRLPTPPRTGNLKPLSGLRIFVYVLYARLRTYGVQISSELSHDRRTWGNVVKSIGDVSSTRSG